MGTNSTSQLSLPLFLLLVLISAISAKILLWSKHPLESLLSLEGAMLSSFWLMLLWVHAPSPQLILTFLCLAVAEASLGLGVLIMMARSHLSAMTPL